MSKSYVCLLVGGAGITFELVVRAERLRRAEVPKAARDRRVLLNVDREVEKVLVLARHLEKR